MPVRAAQAGGLDPDDDAVGGTGRIGDIADRGRLPELRVEDGAHVTDTTRMSGTTPAPES
jgi:hypothetical protein